jgi:hypothetical protein
MVGIRGRRPESPVSGCHSRGQGLLWTRALSTIAGMMPGESGCARRQNTPRCAPQTASAPREERVYAKRLLCPRQWHTSHCILFARPLHWATVSQKQSFGPLRLRRSCSGPGSVSPDWGEEQNGPERNGPERSGPLIPAADPSRRSSGAYRVLSYLQLATHLHQYTAAVPG